MYGFKLLKISYPVFPIVPFCLFLTCVNNIPLYLLRIFIMLILNWIRWIKSASSSISFSVRCFSFTINVPL